ncbi:MAG TPA: pyruvate dehydrogenase complex dihydrolipoamide acetyltransferase [Opitutaceae bacterium]|nr:pyruvate dehydrogenase complex dihydrolipoamide acetyltransferase [Opitutaceae bacterium]
MATIIDMPKLSDTMTVGTLVKWLKNEGDPLSSGMMIAEIETDKATMELECFEDGTLLKQVAKIGDQIAVGAPICVVGKPGEDLSGLNLGKSAAPQAEAKQPAPEKTAERETTAKPAEAQKSAPAAKSEAPKAEPVSHTATPSHTPIAAAVADGRVKVSPLARKIAEQKGVDVSRLRGSGPAGRIVKADVLAAAEGRGSFVTAPGTPAAGKPPANVAPYSPIASAKRGPIAEQKDLPLSNMRATIARRLLEAKTQIPHFYLEIEADAAPLLAVRSQVNAALEGRGVKLSVNDFVLKACVEALRRVPAVNCSWEGTLIRQHSAVHMAFAVAIEDGLITPVIRDAHDKSVFEIAAEAKSLGALAKQKKLKPDQYTGGTFCVSNLGMFGLDRFSAIINPPNAAILAVGGTIKKPVVGPNDTIVVGHRMSLTLSCDHRVVDGALGAQWLAALKDLVEKPALLLL